MDIECLQVKGVKGNYLKAVARVKINSKGIVLNDVKLFCKNNSYWVALPNKEYEVEGKKKYYPLVQFISKEEEKILLNEMRDCLLLELKVGKEFDLHNRIDRLDNPHPTNPDFIDTEFIPLKKIYTNLCTHR